MGAHDLCNVKETDRNRYTPPLFILVKEQRMNDADLKELADSVFPQIIEALATYKETQQLLTSEEKLNVLKALGLEIIEHESGVSVKILWLTVTVSNEQDIQISIDYSRIVNAVKNAS
jgi:hypothetical protein